MQERPERVPFPRPVHISFFANGEGLGDLSRRFHAENLSWGGMFVRALERPAAGTSISVGLEAQGKVFPFAEAEVVWAEDEDELLLLDGRTPGFGLRFTRFLNPRSPQLIEHVFDRHLKVAAETVVETQAVAEPVAELPDETARASFDEPANEPGDAQPRPLHEPLEDLSPAPRIGRATEPAWAQDGLQLGAAELDSDEGVWEPDDEPLRAAPVENPRARWIAAAGVLILLAAAGMAGVMAAQYTVSQQTPDEAHTIIPAPPQSGVVAEVEVEAAGAEPQLVVEPLDVEPLVAEQPVEAPAVVVTPPPRAAERVARAVPAPAAAREQVTIPPAAIAALAPRAGVSGSARPSTGAAREISWRQTGDHLEVTLALAEGASIHRAFILKAPSRLVIDLDHVSPKGSVRESGDGALVQSVRVGAREGGTRLVLDVSKALSPPQVNGRTIRATLAR